MTNTKGPSIYSLLRCLVFGNSNLDHGEREFLRKVADILEQMLIKNELLQDRLVKAEKDSERLDWLEAQVNKNGELHLHDGNHARGIGVGLRPGTLVRTLRAAIDAAKGEPS